MDQELSGHIQLVRIANQVDSYCWHGCATDLQWAFFT